MNEVLKITCSPKANERSAREQAAVLRCREPERVIFNMTMYQYVMKGRTP